jgi:hypothetical protein
MFSPAGLLFRALLGCRIPLYAIPGEGASSMSNGSSLFANQHAQKPHLVTGKSGVPGEVDDLRRDIAAVLGSLAALTVDEFTNPAAGGAAALEAATACTLLGRLVTSFLAPGVAILAAGGRNITITTAGTTPANGPASAVVTGTYLGAAQTETIAGLNGGAATYAGVKPFDTVTSVQYATALDVDATNSIGIGNGLGVARTPLARAGGVVPIREVVDGALVTTGALTADRLYTPAAAPNGAHDYAVYYEYNPAA